MFAKWKFKATHSIENNKNHRYFCMCYFYGLRLDYLIFVNNLPSGFNHSNFTFLVFYSVILVSVVEFLTIFHTIRITNLNFGFVFSFNSQAIEFKHLLAHPETYPIAFYEHLRGWILLFTSVCTGHPFQLSCQLPNRSCELSWVHNPL